MSKKKTALELEPNEQSDLMHMTYHPTQQMPRNADFCVYLGPTIRGVIQSGTIYSGDKTQALAMVSRAVERYPVVAMLIVSSTTLSEDRIKVKTAGNLLYVKYQQLAIGQ